MFLDGSTKGLLACAGALVAGGAYIMNSQDYKEWLEVEQPGGLPPNIFGYGMSWLATVSLRGDRRDFASLRQKADISFLKPEDIAVRQYGEPRIAKWAVPHRQVSQIAYDVDNENEVQAFFQRFIDKYPSCYRGISRIEKSIPALFLKVGNKDKEIIHKHVKDGSFHIFLSRSDAATVIEKGWGELHPNETLSLIASRGESDVMLYATVKPEDYNVYEKVVDASIKFQMTKGTK
ncbi:Piso0_004765 [Millerozyma farinosa CBS 7064]|uniref:Piso0_004765 protein n=1 Tax=Pichia sorbitophila (strain ATCC MYA-4447 / BCRC 22081 / CBS 7064 / NBRC 10061 / NRRL Y-12695) TaxID=559304 RepID=G8Y3B5_PICSO|nr:Piso0_004765 [Millerozyma farinosa CBS 7064]